MGTVILWLVIVFLTAMLMGLWHWVVWRELSSKRNMLSQLARQMTLSRDTAKQASDGPCADSTRLALQTNIAVYREAVKDYEKLRNAPYCYLPARIMGFHHEPEGRDM